MAKRVKRFKDQICDLCAGYMLQHPSLPDWLKCNSCGFCKKGAPKKTKSQQK